MRLSFSTKHFYSVYERFWDFYAYKKLTPYYRVGYVRAPRLNASANDPITVNLGTRRLVFI